MKNRSFPRLAVFVSAVSACSILSVIAQGTAVAPNSALSSEEQLSQQARYWEARDRYDLARETWLKLLRTSPDNPAALAGLATSEAKSGRTAAAQVYLDRLKEARPNDPGLPRIEEAIRQGAFDQDRLAAPRSLAREGKYDEAVVAYRKVFGSDIPGGRLGLEYYQTLAGTENGWNEARTGLEKLARQSPNDPTYAVALAQHLTYREASRREGLSQFETLGDQRGAGDTVRKGWRQALVWLGARPGDEAYYQDYLKKYGDDPEISAKLASLRQGRVVAGGDGGTVAKPVAGARTYAPTAAELHGREVKSAFDLLNHNDLDNAEARFQDMLHRNPNDADSLGGMGVLRLRQERYAESRDYLQQAGRASPRTAGRWSEALAAASFWERVKHGLAARQTGDVDTAERDLRGAISAYPQQAAREPSVNATLADVLVQQGKTQEAEAMYRNILRRKPDDTDAARGLIGLLAGSDRLAEALALANRFPESERSKLGGLGNIKAQYLRAQAEKAADAGDEVRAEGLLKDALLLDPESPFTRMDLARIYQKQHRTHEANTLIDGILVSNPDSPDALFVKAILYSDQQAWYDGLMTLEQIAPGNRTPAMAKLQRRMWVRYQTERASVLAKQGYPQQALAILDEVEPQVGDSPEALGALAIGYADVGDEGKALRYIRSVMAQHPDPDPGLKLVYAGLLFKVHQDAEFEVVMEELMRHGGLTDEQNLDLANLRVGYRLRQADSVREQGDLGRAYEYLQPLLRVNPDDPRVMMALARLYDDSKDYDRSLPIYQRVLARDPDNIDALKGGATAANALKQYDTANAMVDHAMQVDPDNPRLYALAGRVARAQGEDSKALKLYQRALQLDAQDRGPSGYVSPQLDLVDPGRPSSDLVGPRAGFAPMAYHPGMDRPGMNRTESVIGNRTPFHRFGRHPHFQAAVLRTNAVRPSSASSNDRDDRVTPTRRGAYLVKVSSETNGDAPPAPAERPSAYWQQAPRSSSTPPTCAKPKAAAEPKPSSEPVPCATAAPRHRARRHATRRRATAMPSYDPEAIPPRYLPAPPPRVYDVPRQSYSLSPYGEAKSRQYYTPPVAGGGTVDDFGAGSGPGMVLRTDPNLAGPGMALDRKRPGGDDRESLLKEIGELRGNNSGYLDIGLSSRSRDGQSGLERLNDVEVPVEAALPLGTTGRVKLRVVPVYLNSGTVSGTNLPKFGTLELVNNPNLRFSEDDAGVAVGVAYDNNQLHADIGSSPLGMEVQNIVGGIRWSPTFGRTSLKIDLSRRSVTDSLLSYAGLRDPGTDRKWGGVTKSGARLDLSYDLGRYGVYVNGGYHFYQGDNVQNNQSGEGGAGFYIRGIERRDLHLTYGLNVTTFFYNRNLRYFTFGHGGYFSPQQYYSVGVPVTLDGSTRRLSYVLTGSLGLQAFKENGTALYPDDSGLQQQVQVFAAANPGSPAGYSGRTSSGIGFQFGGAAEYLLDRNLSIGGRAGIDNARDYNEVFASAYLRYWFQPQTHVATPPMIVHPYYDYGDPNQ